jgi:hypothetical protein
MDTKVFLSFILQVFAVLTFMTIGQVQGENEKSSNERGTIHMARTKE